MMRIIGGSFGTKGHIWINNKKGNIAVRGDIDKVYTPDLMSHASVADGRERKFSVMSLIFGLLIFTPILTFIGGPIGLIVGLILSIVGSYYTSGGTQVELRFRDDRVVTVECSKRDAKRLLLFANQEA